MLCPTRELAEQIRGDLEPLAAAVDRTVLAVYGGRGLERQLKGLSKGVDLLVACPGRLLDLIDQGAVDLGDVDMVVVDEADRMADMGFLPDVRRLLDQTSPDRQTMLYSATLDRDVQVLVDKYQRDPVEHAVAELEPDLSVLDHRFIEVPKRERVWLTADLVTDMGSSIVFVRTRHGADRVARQLKAHGVKAAAIHGGRSQSQRDQALAQFTGGRAQALVATDVAARGIHVDGVETVIHYDPPAEDKDYVHRSGRTGRAGASGVVISLLDKPQVRESLKMQNRLGIESDVEALPERIHHLQPVSTGSGSGRQRSGSGSGRQRSKQRPRPKSKSQSKPRSRSSNNDRPKPSPSSEPESTEQEAKPKSAKPTDQGKLQKRTRRRPTTGKSGSKSGGKRATGKRTSKRSGKPRPKNRKNKPKGGRSRS